MCRSEQPPGALVGADINLLCILDGVFVLVVELMLDRRVQRVLPEELVHMSAQRT